MPWGQSAPSSGVPATPEQSGLQQAQSPGWVRWKMCPRSGKKDSPPMAAERAAEEAKAAADKADRIFQRQMRK